MPPTLPMANPLFALISRLLARMARIAPWICSRRAPAKYSSQVVDSVSSTGRILKASPSTPITLSGLLSSFNSLPQGTFRTMWCSGGNLVGGMRKPALGRVIGAQHLWQALSRCLSSSTLGLAVEILHKNPSHAVIRLAFNSEAIVPFGPRGNEVAGAGNSQPGPAPTQK